MAGNPAQPDNSRHGDSESLADNRDAQVRDILRHIYDDILSEPVPDSFADLLRKLD